MAKVDVMAKQEDEEKLADVFLLAVTIQRLVSFELRSDVCQLFVYAFNFSFFAFAWKRKRKLANHIPVLGAVRRYNVIKITSFDRKSE